MYFLLLNWRGVNILRIHIKDPQLPKISPCTGLGYFDHFTFVSKSLSVVFHNLFLLLLFRILLGDL